MKGNAKAEAELIKKLRKGAFVKLVLKKAWSGSTTLTEELKIKKWIKDVLIDSPMNNEDCAKTIHYAYPVNRAVPVKDSGNRYGNGGTAAPVELSFVYMDVGGWVGTKKPHAWGDDPRYLKRDFGIVCGPLVALCTYQYAFGEPSCAEWEANKASKKEPWKSVAALIKALSTPSSDHDAELGEVIVRDVIFASDASGNCPRDPNSYVIHVIVGDMHLPVLDQKFQTYGGSRQIPSDEPAFSPTGGQPMVMHTPDGEQTFEDPPHFRDAFEPVAEKPGYVPRLGRLEVGGLEALVKNLVGPDEKDGTKGLDKVVAFAKSALDPSHTLIGAMVASPLLLPATVAGVGAGALTWAAVQAKADTLAADAGVPDDLMSISDSEKWYKYYRDGDNAKSADIHEEAGNHFLHFVKRLASYPAIEKKEKLRPVKFFQLGDMMDFWVGFTCHYKPAPNSDSALKEVDAQGEKMLQVWTANLFGNTKQGQLVAEAIDVLKKGFDPKYLWGNHDNYLSRSPKLKYYRSRGGRPIDLEQRHPLHNKMGVFMEHGHQWDSMNSDDLVPELPLVGTLCPLGLWLTQAAFIRPAPIRRFEGNAAGLVALATGSYGQRMSAVIGAATRYWTESGGFYCYVMGHTHHACLTRVVVSSRYEDELKDFQRRELHNKWVKVAIVHGGVEIEDDKFVNDGSYKDARSVEVVWYGMLALGPEWIFLADALAPPADTRLSLAVKDLAGSAQSMSDARLPFERVPPGVYQARFYLKSQGEMFKRSQHMIAVCGISIEGNPEHLKGEVFEFDPESGFTPRIFLRFAYDPQNEDEQRAWFVICRAGTVNFHELSSSPAKYISYQFLHLNMYRHLRTDSLGWTDIEPAKSKKKPLIPMWGRWDLTRAHPRVWDLLDRTRLPYGDWEIRAFSELGKPMGNAAFTVIKPDPDAKKK